MRRRERHSYPLPVLWNRIVERGRGLSLPRVLLARRARRVTGRAPVVLVPGMFGTRLADARGRTLWGSIPRLYRGPSIASAPDARTDGLFAHLALVPGLAGIDVYGGLVRFLQHAGGYVLGEDLWILDYDWRAGVEAAALALDALVARLRGAGDERVDLAGVSTGGQIVRFFAGHAGAAVRRTVYVGAPQRGTFDALASMHRGFRFAPGGKLFSPAEAALCQTCFDALPHPGERVFTGDDGRQLDLDLYDAAVWARLGLHADAGTPAFQARLDRACAVHRTLDTLPHPAEAVIIGARHLPTPARAVVIEGRARLPPPAPRRDDPFVGYTYAPGDGELGDASLRALPGVTPERVWYATPSAHGKLPSDPRVHELVLEALLATDRPIRETPLGRSLRVVSSSSEGR